MATAKAAPKKAPVAKAAAEDAPRPTANLPVNYAQQLADEAANIAKRVSAPTGNKIRYNGNNGFITPDGMEGPELEVVVVDFITHNNFYEGAFDRNNPTPPACFAIGAEPALMVPSPNSPDKQAEACAKCPNNQYGSAPTGQGKACKNKRALAVIPTSALDNPEEDAPIWVMEIPPASLKTFDAFVTGVRTKHGLPPVGVVASVVMDKSSQYAAPRFSAVRKLTNEELGVFMTRREEAQELLHIEPDVSNYGQPAQAGGRGTGRAVAKPRR